jgi:aminoglycoside phosphotransferase (APT) family kinase protein
MGHLPLLAAGRDADVYALDDAWVLRRYRDGGDASAEVATMRSLARQGYPVPAVRTAQGPDMVLERLAGPTLAAAMTAGQVGVDEGATLLVDLHRRLNAFPPLHGGSGGVQGPVHLDLHPENVLLTGRGPVVIDWRTATDGPAAYDVAMTAVVLAHVAVDPDHPAAAPARAFLRAFTAAVGSYSLPAVDWAVSRRRGNPSLTEREGALVDAAAGLLVAAG